MPFEAFSNNFEKALKILRKDGLMALFNRFYSKLAVALNWRLRSALHKVHIEARTSLGIARCKLVIFCGVPYDDVGGGQRAAQLTQAALRTGIQVLYVYVYPKYDFKQRRTVISRVNIPNLYHQNIKDLTDRDFIKFIHENTTVIFEIPYPACVKYLEIARARGNPTTFELIDDWSTSLGGDWFHPDVFRNFVQNSDTVTATSKVLVEKLVKLGRTDAIYLPNAANEYVFNHNNVYARPSDLPEAPIALYFGSLYGEWFGWEYISAAANMNPTLHICLIGNKPPEIPVSLPENVHFLGEKKNDEIPAYLSSVELCLLSFKPGPLTDAVSPIKVFEYLFMAKPVVSTCIREVQDLPGVSVAHNETEFAQLCARVKKDGNIANPRNSDIEKFIAQNSWFSRLQRIIGLQGQQNTSAIILMHNNRDIIGRCLNSLLDHCASYLADVVVVDNASEDGSAEFLKQNFPQVQVIRNPSNGCSSGRNLGVKHAGGKYLAFFDSDQWFTGGFCFEEALGILESHPEIGAVGWAAGWMDLNDGRIHGSVVDYYPRRAVNARASIKGYRTDVAYLGSGGLFLPRTVFEATGGFDPAFDPTSFEDTDLSFAIKKLGLGLAYRDLTCIRHEAHQTTIASENSPAYQELYTRNSVYLIKKWEDYRHFFIRYTL